MSEPSRKNVLEWEPGKTRCPDCKAKVSDDPEGFQRAVDEAAKRESVRAQREAQAAGKSADEIDAAGDRAAERVRKSPGKALVQGTDGNLRYLKCNCCQRRFMGQAPAKKSGKA